MRRIYESSALDRDDGDPFKPSEGDDTTEPRAARTLPAASLSRLLVPDRLRDRALSLSVSTPASVYRQGDAVPITVRMHNPLPVPVSVTTRSPLLWTWHVDGLQAASHVPAEPPEEARTFTFDRGERKRFSRTWRGLFQVSEAEWEEATPGEYTIGAAINVDDAAGRGLADETTVRLE